MSARAEGKPVDYEKLSDHQLIDVAFERLKLSILPRFLDDNVTRLVRDRIAELGLEERFMQLLGVEIGEHDDGTNHALVSIGIAATFDWVQATPRQQMIAALKAREGNHALTSGARTLSKWPRR